jgi:hypothetical protein
MARSRYPWVIAGFDAADAVRLAAFKTISGESLPINVL